jgi:hypothetical protein
VHTQHADPREQRGGMAEGDRPRLILDYAARAVPEEDAAVRSVRIDQVGEMLVGSRWRPFTARETFGVASTAFTWRARFPLFRGVSLFRVVDRYGDGAGSLRARVLGVLPVVRASGPETSAAEAVRYLAELPWVPHALLANPELRFRADAGRIVEVSLPSRHGIGAVLRLEFDVAGEIARVSGSRVRSGRGTASRQPWGGTFDGYQVVGGVRIPTRAEVYWGTPDAPEPYWRCEVTALAVSGRAGR